MRHDKKLNEEIYEESECNLVRIIENNTIKDVVKKLYTPNNYQDKYAKLYFKARVSLLLNGNSLDILRGNKIIESFEVRSGNPKSSNTLQTNTCIAISVCSINPTIKEK